MFNGFGTYYESNGNYYIGEFRDNFFNGYGKYVSKENLFKDTIYEGIYNNGNFPENSYIKSYIWNIIKNIFILCLFICNIILTVLIFKKSKHQIIK